jgi:hypothetical protein
MSVKNPNWTPEDRTARSMRAAMTRKENDARIKVIGTAPDRPRRVKIKIVEERQERGWHATEVMPAVIIYAADAEQIHKEITNLLEELAKKHSR